MDIFHNKFTSVIGVRTTRKCHMLYTQLYIRSLLIHVHYGGEICGLQHDSYSSELFKPNTAPVNEPV